MFTHLHTHSYYSLLDGLSSIDALLDRCQELGMTSLALTDHGNMYGIIEFYKAAKKRGIKPIIGCEMYVAPDGMHLKKTKQDAVNHHLILIAKNHTGYTNLIKMVTKANLEGFYYKPRIDRQLLREHAEGLIGLSACAGGEIPQAILGGKEKKVDALIKEYTDIFEPGCFYLELQNHPNSKDQAIINDGLIALSKKYNLPLVATNDIHYANIEDKDAQDVLICIQTNRKVTEENRMKMTDFDLHMNSPEEMAEAFSHVPEAIANTQKIADMCEVEIELGNTKLPNFKVPEEFTDVTFLHKLCEEGLAYRYGENITPEIRDRLKYELSVIDKTGFASYFLIVNDFVMWAKNNGIVVGPGRGCFLPHTKILLKDGHQKNIEDIKIKDRVITALGNKRIVKKVLNYDINEEIAIITSKMPAFDLKLTKDHKVLAAKHQMCPLVAASKKTICKPSCNRACKKKLWKNYQLQWIEAQNLTKNDFLVYPIVKHKQIQKTSFDLLNYNGLDAHLKGNSKHVWYENGTNKLIPKKIKRYIKLDKNFAQLLGFYIAEGWSRTRRKYREGTIGFGFHCNEKEYIKKVAKLLKQVFGLESSITFHKTRNSCQVHAYSRIAAKLMERICGDNSENKHIPYQIFTSSDEIVIALLTTLFQGDGSNKGTMRISLDSISYNLISQTKMLLARLEIMSSIKIRKYKNKKWHQSYKLTVSGKQLFKFNQLFKNFQISIKKQAFYRNDTFIRQNYIWMPVKEVLFQKYKGKVYDLTVDKDSSYVANEIAVHNSAAGSLVAYLLRITDIDPLTYNLLFERFLNPARISMPDIDMDFADIGRDKVLRYVSEKYGRDHVAQIISFGTMAARAAVRDTGRALGYEYSLCNEISQKIPMFCSIDKALEVSAELKEMYDNNEDAKKLIDFAKKMEGVKRHASTHACGVVITKDPLYLYTPCQKSSHSEENITTQYEMHAIEELGLLKMDFLGLSNLTTLEKAIELIQQTSDIDIQLDKIPLNNEETYTNTFKKGQTTGVFQMESAGMKRYLKQLKPTNIEDIIAMVALYRPGPMDLIPDFIDRKHGLKEIEYIHPKLEPILKNTYGIAIYQEQLMQMARDLAGFSLAEADLLRKAIGKKIKTLLDEQKINLIKGMIANGISKDIAKQIWKIIEPFASYGFNRSHAACYALIGYWTAYFKTHYPAEFMCALLISDQGNLDRATIEIDECKALDIAILPPDINKSFENFSIEMRDGKKCIRFGFNAIKNMGENISQEIVKERKENGEFLSIEDLATRITSRDMNKKSLEALAKCGALENFGERNKIINNISQILSYAKELQANKEKGQDSLFSLMPEPATSESSLTLSLADTEPATKKERLAWEKELLGLYISEHPLEDYKKYLERYTTACNNLTDKDVGKDVRLGGIISKVKKISTKKNKTMVFAELEDLTSKIEIVVFPKMLQETLELWEQDNIILVSGKVDNRDGTLKILCEGASRIMPQVALASPLSS